MLRMHLPGLLFYLCSEQGMVQATTGLKESGNQQSQPIDLQAVVVIISVLYARDRRRGMGGQAGWSQE